MTFNNLLINTEHKISTITINRPNKLNALNSQTISELSESIKLLEVDISTRVIIITGMGNKSFVAGADISEFADFNSEQGMQLSELGQHTLFNVIENCSKPVIAAVNGFALGGGLELAMASHIRVMSVNAKMGLPETSLGLIPGYGGTQRLTQLIGKGRALEMIMTAKMILADEALKIGLANHVVNQDDLLNFCKQIANKIINNSPKAISSAIKATNASLVNNINGFDVEISEFGKCFDTDDFKEGTTAFLEKRKPIF
ncbi:MAG: enoyl-CoA hydratase/isomerase family protein [Ichthyobacteriaceae bacterium]|nr:enoyl-CoA hydratase/isomerase family protein [Ichthyobacteriaceae bacterium]